MLPTNDSQWMPALSAMLPQMTFFMHLLMVMMFVTAALGAYLVAAALLYHRAFFVDYAAAFPGSSRVEARLAMMSTSW